MKPEEFRIFDRKNNEIVIGNLGHYFGEEEDYYRPYKIRGSFNENYVEYMSSGSNDLTIAQYLNEIRPYLENVIKRCKKLNECEIQLTMNNIFMSFKK